MLDPIKLIALVLPTLLIFCGLSWSWFDGSSVHREVFGNGDTYLDIRFPGPRSATASAFQGTLVTEVGEEKIAGVRAKVSGQTQYVFATSRGRFTGTLAAPSKGCEPSLHYQLEKNGQKTRKGKLAAGFCL